MQPESLRLILTRPDPENTPWLTTLTELGAAVVAWPLIDIAPASNAPEQLDPLWRSIAEFRAVMFVSRSAVGHFFHRRPQGLAWPTPTRAWCTGPGTRKALLDQGLTAGAIDAPPPGSTWDTEHLWPVVSAQVGPGHRFLFVRGTDDANGTARATDTEHRTASLDEGVGRDWLAQQVNRLGGQVSWAVSYVRALPRWDAHQIERARRSAVDGSIWVFSSSQALTHLQRLLPGQDWSRARAVATHDRIAQRAQELGFGQVSTSQPDPRQVWASLKSLA